MYLDLRCSPGHLKYNSSKVHFRFLQTELPVQGGMMTLLTLTDGRNLEFYSNGIKSDKAILFMHGTPGDATTWKSWLSEIDSVTTISTSRPGYGLSDRQLGRSVADDLSNQKAILDFLGIKEFVSIGWSGGGPHSLNMTRDERCKAAFTLAGVGEFGNADLDFLEGMGQENHDEFGAALLGEREIQNWMQVNAKAYKEVTGADLIAAFGGLIGDADKKALTPDVAETMASAFRSALARSFDGWVDDDLAFVRAFGFDLAKIDKPVIIWQGDEDFMVPHSHSVWLNSKIPNSQLKFVPGHGHISLTEQFRSEIINSALSYL